MASAYPPTGSQPPSVELTVRQGPQPGQRFSLTRPTITIGREAGNDVVINDPQISRRHASLTWDGRQFIIQDLGSANGTFVNGVRLTGPQVLQQGDVIGLGPTVHLGFQAMPVAPVPPHSAPPPAHPPPPPAYAPRPPARRRGRFLIPLTALLGLCFVLAVAAALGYFFLWPRPDARPVVLINSPRHGEQVEVGQEVTVRSVARDEGKVTRVELWVDGQLQETQTSNLPGGSSPFPLLAHWRPSSPGTHTLIARAFNARGGRGQASVNVEAMESADRDGDGVADEADACPDEPGPLAANGCPDRDGDGIPDAEDACPDEAGLPEADGCPSPSEEDRDGDGLLDEADACPDEAGSPRADGCPDADDDGIPDAEDACPAEPGLPEHDGCPVEGDMDGDGVPDAEDDCPEESGLPEHAGCSDNDGDGVRDVDDDCPGEPGLPEHDGCPDSDGDGVPDPDDLRPEDPGGPGSGGAPDTGAGDRDGDGIPDDIDDCPGDFGPGPSGCPLDEPEEPEGGGVFGDMGDWGTVWTVEFQALEFEVFDDYDEVYCYASLADGDEDRYGPFDIGDEARHWNISSELGSRFVAFEADSLRVHAECWAANIYREPPPEEPLPPGVFPDAGAEGVVWDLGSFAREHPRSDWDGHVITVESDPGPDGHSFEVQYRICQDSCEEAAFAPPVLTLWRIGDLFQLRWRWDGDEESIHGFNVYRNGNYAFHLSEPSARSVTLIEEPPCGQRWEYQVAAYSGPDPVHPDRESPRSNIRFLEGLPCPRTVRVHFQTLETGNLGGDEREYDTVGPISGNFWVSGSTRGELDFHTSVCPILGGCDSCRHRDIRHGLRLDHHTTYRVQDIFDWVHTEQASCWSPGCEANHYWAPDVNSVTVQLDDGDDLTFGARIQDVDWGCGEGSEWETLFEDDDTLSADEVPAPGGGGERTIRDRNIVLRVWIMTLHD